MRPTAHVRRPKHRPHRRHSRRFQALLDAMTTKYDTHQASITVSSVGSDVLALPSSPAGKGPFVLTGALPPELRGESQFWLTEDVSHNATLYSSLGAMRRAISKTLASWALSLNWASLTATTMVLASATDVANATETFTKVAHGFVSGAGPFRATTSSALPTGLATGTDYYLIKVTADTFKLSDTKAHAIAGTNVVAISDDGTGNQTFTLAGVDVTADQVTVTAHGMPTGAGPVRLATTGTLPAGLLAATDYYVISVDANTIQLATTYANAIAGTAIDITNIGSGSHTLPRALKLKKDLSAAGLVRYIAQGVKPETMVKGSNADVETIFS